MCIVNTKVIKFKLDLQKINKLTAIIKKKNKRDITLPTKVRLVKAVVFPVVMDGCESWDGEES